MNTSSLRNALFAAGILALVSGCEKRGGSPSASVPAPPPPPSAESSTTQASAPASAGTAASSTGGTEAAAAAARASIPAAGNTERLVLMATIEGPDANAEFQRNVQLVQRQRQIIIALQRRLQEATDSAERAQIEQQIQQALEQLNRNNQAMFENYGFSLTRNYAYVIERSSIYLQVSEEEAARIAEQQAGSEESNGGNGN